MTRNKHFVTGVSFVLGIMLVAVTAFADIISETGYDQLKNVIKNTFEQTAAGAEGELKNFTFKGEVKVTHNDKVVFNSTSVQKYDGVNNLSEGKETTKELGKEDSYSYSYQDANTSIHYNQRQDTYVVYEYLEERQVHNSFRNPFEEDRMKDVERIIDAVVGNLKEHVIVEQRSDGNKEFTGSLNNSQIPTIINAVASFFFKQQFSYNNYNQQESFIPELDSDVHIKSVAGRINSDQDDVIQKAFATIVLSGKDKAGENHELTFEILIEMTDVNKTVVERPNLEGKNVETHTRDNKFRDMPRAITEKYIGTWKNEIIMDTDNQLKKIGERMLEITSVDENSVEGKYYEVYTEEFKNMGNMEFEFKAVIDNNHNRGANLETITLDNGININGNIHFEPTGIYFYTDHIRVSQPGVYYNGGFRRVFEE